MRTKKVRKSRQTFRSVGNPSEMSSVMVQTGHVSDMRADNSVGDAVDIGVGNTVGISVGECGKIP